MKLLKRSIVSKKTQYFRQLASINLRLRKKKKGNDNTKEFSLELN